MKYCTTHLLFITLLFSFTGFSQAPEHPESYTCFKTHYPISVDGVLEDCEWGKVPWTNEFVDIEGKKMPVPLYSTRVKMLWDDQYFYFAAQIKEPHIWAYLTERDAVIFYDNDFEIFIDPQGDNHHYYEFEMNAQNTVWDLMLPKPYRDGGSAIDSWDIAGLKSAVRIYGTLNNGNDTDSMWTAEVAIPWQVLEECAYHNGKPNNKEVWRVNFSRVNWKTKFIDGKYVKEINPTTGQAYPEFNWVWSAQGAIAMHQPETWGYVQFIDQATPQNLPQKYIDIDYPVKIELMNHYFAVAKIYQNKPLLQDYIKQCSKKSKDCKIEHTSYQFSISKKGKSGTTWVVNQEGKLFAE